VLLRLTWQDSIPVLAPFFYATPLALIWTGLLSASGLFLALRMPSLAFWAAFSAIVGWGWWEQTHMLRANEATSANSVRVVFWNTARLKAGWPSVAERIAQRSSPLMGFVEAGPDDSEDRQRWQRAFPDHRPIFFGNGMVLLTQGNVLDVSRGELAKGCYYGRAKLNWDGKPLTVLLVDIHSSPFFSRETALANLTELANELRAVPVLIMGDFNTPADSVHFRDLRESFRNAFEAGGRGHVATWPVPCPVLAIDHIWTSPRISVHRARHDWSLESDHCAVIAELSFSE
jgi:hypothetical protein